MLEVDVEDNRVDNQEEENVVINPNPFKRQKTDSTISEPTSVATTVFGPPVFYKAKPIETNIYDRVSTLRKLAHSELSLIAKRI